MITYPLALAKTRMQVAGYAHCGYTYCGYTYYGYTYYGCTYYGYTYYGFPDADCWHGNKCNPS